MSITCNKKEKRKIMNRPATYEVRTQLNGYEELANAIILQACKDYKSYKYRDEVRTFFNTQYANLLSHNHNKAILEELERRYL